MIDAVVILVSAIIGSFLNVCIYRIPREESLWGPRSHCPACGHWVRGFDNIPVLSYFILRGRCRDCRTGISWQYPAVEFAAAAAGWGVYRLFGLTLDGGAFASFTFALIVLTMIDLEHQILPNVITYPLSVAGLSLSVMWDRVSPVQSLIGLVVGGGSLYLIALGSQWILRQEGMGLGDVKLGAAMGAWLGARYLLLSYFFAFVLGALIGGTLILTGVKGRRDHIPFGPFLATGALIMVFCHPYVDEWFHRFLGG